MTTDKSEKMHQDNMEALKEIKKAVMELIEENRLLEAENKELKEKLNGL